MVIPGVFADTCTWAPRETVVQVGPSSSTKKTHECRNKQGALK
jgi:hypothetical protein